MNAPCYQCTDRHEKCHAECERYKEFERQRSEIRKRKFEAMRVNGYCIETAKKVKAEKRRRKK